MSAPPRSWLFVPADSERKVTRALGSDADATILDLEDAVAPARKEIARAMLPELLGEPRQGGPQRWVRINPLDGPHAPADLAAVRDLAVAGVVLPKSESGADVARLAAALDGTGLRIHAVVTETAASLFGLAGYRDAPRLAAMCWGAEDLSAALGAASKYDSDGGLSFTYRMARSLCLAGAVAAGVQPVDGVFTDFRDPDGLAREAAAAAREGFTGKLAIHPDQVAVINAAFTPSAAEVDAARRIVGAFAADPDAGTIALDGRMLDRPHLVQAERTLARAARG